ncbi:hypothetical protein SPAB_04797 [Salmonella enterica subsp. enterica serovar Paratyphi B str. SPB7]|uniref:Uncharacterized protein n=1 Tax=Salmonella paratyphi B (strain ATCC BAA-1250 / SPB7) TaxID=1016998 RepID=A0A6C6Z7X6_SALPB|nr:hypothetical protein SPAB_04797 [Salmonella enterica subsp. enterica serovar Paratyphi B str. SPB7]
MADGATLIRLRFRPQAHVVGRISVAPSGRGNVVKRV